MPRRRYLSGCEKRKKKQRVEQLIESQRGSMNRFVTSDKQMEPIVESIENEVSEEGGNEILDKMDQNEDEVHEEMNQNEDEVHEEMNQNEDSINIDDPSNWDKMDQNLRDLLVVRGPAREDRDFNYPYDDNGSTKPRHFSSVHYVRHLANGEKHDRKWLIYSTKKNRVFCFCCKLFKQEGNKTQLATGGFKDWKNIVLRLKEHEGSHEHITCMSKWIELEKRLTKNQTIDKCAQEQVNKEREHLRRVLLMVIAIVKTLAKQNLPFRGSNEKIHQESNGNFLSMVEMIAEFEPIMEEHLRRIEKGEIQFDEIVDQDMTLSLEESFRVNYFLYIVDQARSSLKNRFEQFKEYEENFGFLFDLKKSNGECLRKCCAKLEECLKHAGVSDIDGRDLFIELKVLKDIVPQEVSKPIEVLNNLRGMEDIYPNAWIAYRVLLTIPVTVASGERSFSKLKMIKSYLRSTMSQERLNGLAMLSIENDFAGRLDYESLIDKFASKNARRVVFK